MTPRDGDPLTVEEEVAAVIDTWQQPQMIVTYPPRTADRLVGLLLAALSGALVMAVIFAVFR